MKSKLEQLDREMQDLKQQIAMAEGAQQPPAQSLVGTNTALGSMEFELTRAFPTLIGRLRVPDPEMMNQELQAIILADEAEYSSLGRSNIGGWHSRPDFLNKPHPAVSFFRAWLRWALRQMIDSTAGANALQGTLSLSAWATLCRAAAYYAPHSHRDSAWSGVYYVNRGSDNSDQPLSGVLEFLDSRAGVEAVTAPGDPYGEPFRVRPEAGLLVVFPSRLYHWVHPYTGQRPRIAISFNAIVAAVSGNLSATSARLARKENSYVDSSLVA